MKRFISMVMASAMMISMVPATALAAATDRVVAAATINDAIDVATEKDDIHIAQEDASELKLRFTKAESGISETDFEITLEDAYWDVTTEAAFE